MMYHAIKKEQGFQLIPITTDVPYVVADYSDLDNSLLLQSVHSYEDFRFTAKMDDFGKPVFGIGKDQKSQKVERWIMNIKYQFELKGDDILWFLDTFTDNPEVAKGWIQPIGHQGNPEPEQGAQP
jgi:hypothetical protein